MEKKLEDISKQDESLEDAAKEYSEQSFAAMEKEIMELRFKPFSFVKESIIDWSKLDFQAGANCQAEKDKATIAALVEALRTMVDYHHSDADSAYINAVELLNNLKK